MQGKVIRQHYIPQMYLKRFCDSSGQLYAFDLITHKGIRNLPKAFAQKKFFYDLPADDLYSILESLYSNSPSLLKQLSQKQVVENMLSNIEGEASTVLNGIIDESIDLSNEDAVVKLVTFLHTLSIRTSIYRTITQKFHEQIAPFLQDLGGISTPNLSAYCNVSSDTYARKSQIEQLLNPIQTGAFYIKLHENYNWYIATVQSNMKLITSDNPVQMISLGFNDCCFPISPNKAIIFRVKAESAPLISFDTPVNGVIHLSTPSVLAYNKLQLTQAERFLFGDKASIDHLLRHS